MPNSIDAVDAQSPGAGRSDRPVQRGQVGQPSPEPVSRTAPPVTTISAVGDQRWPAPPGETVAGEKAAGRAGTPPMLGGAPRASSTRPRRLRAGGRGGSRPPGWARPRSPRRLRPVPHQHPGDPADRPGGSGGGDGRRDPSRRGTRAAAGDRSGPAAGGPARVVAERVPAGRAHASRAVHEVPAARSPPCRPHTRRARAKVRQGPRAVDARRGQSSRSRAGPALPVHAGTARPVTANVRPGTSGQRGDSARAR